jgi:hypothetical protein
VAKDEYTRGGGVDVAGRDVADDAAAPGVGENGVAHERVAVLVVD